MQHRTVCGGFVQTLCDTRCKRFAYTKTKLNGLVNIRNVHNRHERDHYEEIRNCELETHYVPRFHQGIS